MLDPARKELHDMGFLADVRYENGDQKVVRYVVSECFARRRAAHELSGSPEEFIAVERLLSEGVRGDVARDLVARHGPGCCLKYAEALPFQANLRNKPGWLRKAIEQGYDIRTSLPPTSPPQERDTAADGKRRREDYAWFFGERSPERW